MVEQFGRIRIIDETASFCQSRSSTSATRWSPCGPTSTSAGCSAWPSIRTTRKTASSTWPIARRPISRRISPRCSGGITPTWSPNTPSTPTTRTAPTGSSERIITSIDWPQFNHNGHWIGFGRDGYLYIATGDGGYANDWGIGHNVTEGNGQDTTSLHGKILRIDVDNPSDGRNYGIPEDNPFANDNNFEPEIWAYGLRNPWRCSFDTAATETQLICADVQQNSYEEVNVISAGDNLGWRKMEADHCFDYLQPDNHPADCDQAGLVGPVIEYENCTARPQNCMGISVTGGYVYRGSHADWDGKYIFGDWSKSFAEMDGQIFIATPSDEGMWEMELASTDMEAVPYILAFAQDAEGEVYALTSITTGPVGGLDTIYRIVPAD